MPTDKNTREHSARITEPGQYARFATLEDKGGKGVNFIVGFKKKADPKGGHSEVQAIRFDAKHWSVADAKKWLKDNDKVYIKFTPAAVDEDAAPAATGDAPTTTTGDIAVYAAKVGPMVSHYGDYKKDRYDQSHMARMRKKMNEEYSGVEDFLDKKIDEYNDIKVPTNRSMSYTYEDGDVTIYSGDNPVFGPGNIVYAKEFLEKAIRANKEATGTSEEDVVESVSLSAVEQKLIEDLKKQPNGDITLKKSDSGVAEYFDLYKRGLVNWKINDDGTITFSLD